MLAHPLGCSRIPKSTILAAMLAGLALPPRAMAVTPFVREAVDAPVEATTSSLALDAQGNPHISYYDFGNGDLKYASKSGASWTIETAEAPFTIGEWSSLALDAQGNPRISYRDATNFYLRYASKSGGVWTRESVDGPGVGEFTSIALDAQGNPRVSYWDRSNDDLKYASRSGGSWTVETVDATGSVGLYSSVALDAQGNPHISYLDVTNGNLKYASKLAGSWTFEIPDAVGSVGAYTSLVLDAQGNPRISYQDVTAPTNGNLKYASKSGGSWTSETVDGSATSGGDWTSIALDAQGNPHISYKDFIIGLKYASKSGSSWTLETLNVKGGSSSSDATSLVLDAQGNPRISYQDFYDFPTSHLRYSDSSVHVLDPAGGVTWAVGSMQNVRWSGSGTVDVYLSVDGGQTFGLFLDDYTDNSLVVRVPHSPTRYARIRVERSSPFSVAFSDSFFKIDATIALAKFEARAMADEPGVALAWETRPGPEASIRYRIDRAATDGEELAPWEPAHEGLLDRGEYVDRRAATTAGGAIYRLTAVNGFGEEYVLGETSVVPSLGGERDLTVLPNPSPGGKVTVRYRSESSRLATDVSVFDASGRRVRTLVSGTFAPGIREVRWDGQDGQGETVAAGVYIISLSWKGARRDTRRLVVLR